MGVKSVTAPTARPTRSEGTWKPGSAEGDAGSAKKSRRRDAASVTASRKGDGGRVRDDMITYGRRGSAREGNDRPRVPQASFMQHLHRLFGCGGQSRRSF